MNATSTLLLAPPHTDRIRAGRTFAGELLSEDPADRALARRGVHPDLIELAPPAGKERVGIESVKEAIRSVQFAPVHARRKVCLIPFAERLTPEAANALLKTLEEPPRDTAFVLLASHPAELLPTIVSRSRIVRLPPQEKGAVIERLLSAGYSKSDAEWLAGIPLRDGEIDRLVAEPVDVDSAREEGLNRVREADGAGLIDAATSGGPILRHAALIEIIGRAASRDHELLTGGIRYLSSKEREVVSLFLQDLLAAAFGLIKERLEEASGEKGRISLPYLRRLSLGLDTAHRAVEAYTPIEGALLSALLGGETDGR